MSKYRQIREPNLDPTIYQGGKILNDWLGWCLAYVQTAFGAPWAGSNAWQSWTQKTSFRHEDWEFPVGVKIPIWFDYWLGGARLGHVAILEKKTDGSLTIWSSPISYKPYADTWSTIQQVEAKYGARFVGWSEDIGGTRVVEPVADPEPAPALKDNQRLVTNTDGINGRTAPTKDAPAVQEYGRGATLDFDYVVEGQDPYGNGYNYWGHGAIKGNYWWLGATNDPTPGKLPVREYFAPGTAPTDPTIPTPTPSVPTKPTYPAPTNDPAVTAVYNKKHPVGAEYAPTDLVSVGNGQTLRKEAADSLALMQAAALADGVTLSPQSGYRSYGAQKTLYENYVKQDGQEKADTYSARPGYSEHQTGLTIDFAPIDEAFKTGAASRWLIASAHKFGWVLRYPETLTNITGYKYEPWHWRYIGVDAATDMHNRGVGTLEYYYNIEGGGYPEPPAPTPEEPDPEIPSTPAEPAPPVPAPEAAASAAKFVARLGTQFATVALFVQGASALVEFYTKFHIDAGLQGWITVIVTVVLIAALQFGYKLGSNIKWPF